MLQLAHQRSSFLYAIGTSDRIQHSINQNILQYMQFLLIFNEFFLKFYIFKHSSDFINKQQSPQYRNPLKNLNFYKQTITQHPLNTQAVSQNLHQSSKPQFSLYFLKGNDQRQLSVQQSLEIMNLLIESKNKSSMLIYNSHEVRRKYHKWTEMLPWIKPHYAIKANPTLPLLMDLVEEGSNFDCASKTELQLMLNLGVNPKDLVYSNPIKEQDDLQWADQHNISLTTADTIDQLRKIKQHAPKMKILWRIAIKQEKSDHLSTPFSNKFGDDLFLENEQKIHNRMKQVQQMNINLSGIHFHCGSGQHGSSAFEKAILTARRCMEIGRMYGHQMTTMDLGGGFPSGELSQKTINALKMTQDDPLGYRVIAEPGRHFCSYSSYLLTRVLGKREKSNKPCYHLNESLYHSFNCNIMDGVSFQNSTTQFYSSISSCSQSILSINQTQESTLFGMTCDGMDVITQNIHCPTKMNVGDWLVVGGMGAYTYGCRSEFNGMKSCEKVLRWNGRIIDNGAEAE